MAKEEFIEPKSPDSTGPLLRRGRVETIDLYEIKDTELAELEAGSKGDIHLNLCIFVFTLGASSLNTLHTVKFPPSDVAVFTHVAITVVCAVLTPIFLVLWVTNRLSMKKLCRKIRQRIENEPIRGSQSPGTDDSDPGE